MSKAALPLEVIFCGFCEAISEKFGDTFLCLI